MYWLADGRLRVGLTFVILCEICLLRPAAAQSFWTRVNEKKLIGIEVMKPAFRSQENLAGTSSAALLWGRYRLSNSVVFVYEFPFSHWREKRMTNQFFTREAQSKVGFGNPLMGFELLHQGLPVYYDFGVRLPIAVGDNAAAMSIGVISDFDRFEAFIPDKFSLYGAANFFHDAGNGLFLRVRLGSLLLVNTERQMGIKGEEYYLSYGVQGGFAFSSVSLAAGLTGRLILFEEGLTFADRTTQQLGAAFNFNLGIFQPGLYWRVPLDGALKSSLKSVLGAALLWRLP